MRDEKKNQYSYVLKFQLYLQHVAAVADVTVTVAAVLVDVVVVVNAM